MDGIDLHNGNCFDIIPGLPDRSVDLLLTDPPYDIDVHDGGRMYANKKMQPAIDGLEKSDINRSYDIEGFSDIVMPKFRTGVNAYFWCNKRQIYDYMKCWVGRHGCRFEIIKWFKTNAIPNYSNKYMTDTEYCLYFYNGAGHCHPASYEDASTLYMAPINQTDKKLYNHPTIKPLKLIERMVLNSSLEGETVLDPFMGSGTTGEACARHGRKFIGIELDKTYFATASRRISEPEHGQIELF